MIEKELKYLLTKNDYLVLKEYFEKYGEQKKLAIMHTYYYDTIPFKLLPSITFRLRLLEGIEGITLSVKANIKGRLPSEEKEELQVAKELNFDLNNIDINMFKQYFPLDAKTLNKIGVDEKAITFIQQLKEDLSIDEESLTFLGKNEIERIHGILPFYNMPFDLDYAKYSKDFDMTNFYEDYELEIEDENPDKFINVVQNIFRQKDIKVLGSKKKIQRLLEYIHSP